VVFAVGDNTSDVLKVQVVLRTVVPFVIRLF
jgi:hypothetical protein